MLNRSPIQLFTLLSTLISLSAFDAVHPKLTVIPLSPMNGIFLPIVGQLRKNKKLFSLMKKVQDSQKAANPQDPDSGKPSLNENEIKEVQTAIEQEYKSALKDITDSIQKVSNEKKCMYYVKVETDMQLIPGIPFTIEFLVTPDKSKLSSDELSYVVSYKEAFSAGQKAMQDVIQSRFKSIGMLPSDDALGAKK